MVKANGLKFEEIEVDKIIPNPLNPRIDLKPGMPLYEKLKKSIEEFDYSEPIVVNKEQDGNYMIISGHQRLQVMKDVAEEKGEEIKTVSVIVKQYDKQHRDALTIALNKITGLWDQEKLAQLFTDMDETMKEFTGFDEFEIDNLLNDDDSSALFGEDTPEVFAEGSLQDSFSVTFVFPKTKKEDIMKAIKEKGKEEITNKILDLILK